MKPGLGTRLEEGCKGYGGHVITPKHFLLSKVYSLPRLETHDQRVKPAPHLMTWTAPKARLNETRIGNQRMGKAAMGTRWANKFSIGSNFTGWRSRTAQGSWSWESSFFYLAALSCQKSCGMQVWAACSFAILPQVLLCGPGWPQLWYGKLLF